MAFINILITPTVLGMKVKAYTNSISRHCNVTSNCMLPPKFTPFLPSLLGPGRFSCVTMEHLESHPTGPWWGLLTHTARTRASTKLATSLLVTWLEGMLCYCRMLFSSLPIFLCHPFERWQWMKAKNGTLQNKVDNLATLTQT